MRAPTSKASPKHGHPVPHKINLRQIGRAAARKGDSSVAQKIAHQAPSEEGLLFMNKKKQKPFDIRCCQRWGQEILP